MADVVTGATSTVNIAPSLKITDLNFKVVSKKRNKKKGKKK